ncbi:preprotein translocase subunit YajC [Acinetobacter rudis]|uniref:Preprotein translocase subunit YajC n=1 Tax=Acinetobacter rudis CIP 110305 TaxID=421052 RepID=S3NIK4_9GAMM|nr:preprotein translocase subunit YajC [Acinetobacter rudis]EPF79890.1 hypothetical protein F945_00778 [Acinetobacter rudis CIP 110305]
MLNFHDNYQLGLIVLILAFLIFYIPVVYAFIAIRKQRKQNK